ncbi:MAG TPA: hypothetical protein VLZ77_00965 [Acidimicrobiales bacterium]|nr:hypothetical protein [Acidimicrobiales bacterium]
MEHVRSARAMWQVFEPVHAVTYFTDEAVEAFGAAGLKGFWMGYFAGRAAPMGGVGPAVVDATFFNFSPRRVTRALPDAWGFAPPGRVLEARLAGVEGAYARILGPKRAGLDLAGAAGLARAAVESLTVAGRPLAAANAALAWPEDPLLALWQAATVLREHRGDGHVAALVDAGLDGRQALVMMAATGRVPRDLLQASRGWSDDEWDEAVAALAERGWVNAQGAATPTGTLDRQAIEDATDRLAGEPWARLGEERTAALRAVLGHLVGALVAAGAVVEPNPIGLSLGPP